MTKSKWVSLSTIQRLNLYYKALFFFFCFAGRKNNWPPLPENFPVGPCFYQDFSVDIPVEFQKTVKIMYYLWMCKYFFKEKKSAYSNLMINTTATAFATSRSRMLKWNLFVSFNFKSTELFHRNFHGKKKKEEDYPKAILF